MNIRVLLRKDLISKNGVAPLFLRFTSDRKSKYISLGISIGIEHWNPETQTINNQHPSAKELQYQIDTQLKEYDKRIKRLEALDLPITFENLFEPKEKSLQCMTVNDYFKRRVDSLKSVDKLETATKYHYTLISMNKFRSTALLFNDIDYSYLVDFESYLLHENIKTNSIATKFSVLKAVYNKAISDGVFTPKDNPFLKFKVGRLWGATRKRAITKDDVLKLLEFEPSKQKTPYLEFAKDIFLFSYFMAGINFKDIATLKYCDIINGRIYYARHKTSKEMNCKLHEQALTIIDKYSNGHQNDDDYIFPILDKQIHITELQRSNRIHKVLGKVNERLSELGEMIGIKVHLTTYVARHTYATVLKRSGVNIAIISESLGHSDLSTTQIYLDSFENSQIDEAMQNLL